MSQRELAGKVGIDFTYLSKIENEILPPPSEEKIALLAKALGADKAVLLGAARKVPADLQARVSKMPPEAAALLHRIARGNMTRQQFKDMLKVAEAGREARGVQTRAVPGAGGDRGRQR